MRNSYHGRTFGTVAITGNAAWKASGNEPFGVHYLHGTDRVQGVYAGLSDAEYIAECVTDLRAVLAGIHPQDIGALIAEPVQCAGGVTTAPDGLFKAYNEVLDGHGLPLTSHGGVTGSGPTGP